MPLDNRKQRDRCRSKRTSWRAFGTESLKCWCIFDVAGKEDEITRLEKQSAQPDFWADQAVARSTMRKLAEHRRVVDRWRSLEKKVADMDELIGLAVEEEDTSLEEEIRSELEKIGTQLDELELELAFRSEYDARNAILAIHAGAGGTESQDWAEMLLRMYLRWAERRGYDAEVLDTYTGKVIRQGLDNIPDKKEAGSLVRSLRFDPFDDEEKKDRERRILNAYDKEVCCAGDPCALPGAPEG